jgi:hypothetical protein
VALALLLPASTLAHEVGASRYDYARDVRPIFVRHCAPCHRPGGVAPMSLLRYEEASPWANAIKLMVLERRMPPWLPEEGLASLREAKGLTAPELDRVVEWASGGAPRGDGSEGHEEAPSGGPLPDLTLEALRESLLGPEEAERTECVVFEARLPGDRALAAVRLQPGPESILRSATVYVGDGCDEEEPPLATWLPGDGAFELPGGAAQVLRRGAPLSARILLRKAWSHQGRVFRERSRLGLYFAKGRTSRLEHVNLAPGAATTFRRAVRIVALFPRGPRGTPAGLEALRPGGSRQRLFAIERLDPDWRAKYVLDPPLELGAGTRLLAAEGGFWIDYLPAGPLKASRPPASSNGSP